MPSKSTKNIVSFRKVLKHQIKSKVLMEILSSEFSQLVDVMKRTIEYCESDSVLVVGPHGSGKSMLISEAMKELRKNCKAKDFIVINLNGLIHVDDNLALYDIIRQLNVESIDTETFTGSFSEKLQYVLNSLRDSEDKISTPLIFVLEEFHLFCSHRNQTLLYNLFDSAQSSQGICVVGITTRLDVTEMLEKRVKSRFSHRQLLLLHHPTAEQRISLFKDLLTLSNVSDYAKVEILSVQSWNKNISKLCTNNKVIRILKRQLELDINESNFRSFLLMLVSLLTEDHNQLTPEDIVTVYQNLSTDNKVAYLQGLSVLEICLIIAMSHQNEIFDGEPFNFEMIVNRYLKFASQNYAVQIMQRPVILKAFERIKNLELISPVGANAKNVQKEFQLYNFLLTKEQVMTAVNNYSGIPTDVSQWASSSLM